MCRVKILLVSLYGCGTWSFIQREHKLKMSENQVLREICKRMRGKVREDWRKLLNEELDNFYAHS
jgi:hypothetical protein